MLNTLAALATCVIVYADDRPSSQEIRRHEIAHCNGWTHPERNDHLKPGYRANQAPQKYLKPYAGKLDEYPLSSSEARKHCNGHLGCQWFE